MGTKLKRAPCPHVRGKLRILPVWNISQVSIIDIIGGKGCGGIRKWEMPKNDKSTSPFAEAEPRPAWLALVPASFCLELPTPSEPADQDAVEVVLYFDKARYYDMP